MPFYCVNGTNAVSLHSQNTVQQNKQTMIINTLLLIHKCHVHFRVCGICRNAPRLLLIAKQLREWCVPSVCQWLLMCQHRMCLMNVPCGTVQQSINTQKCHFREVECHFKNVKDTVWNLAHLWNRLHLISTIQIILYIYFVCILSCPSQ